MSHVYVPEGGLVNVEVAGGEVYLKAEATEGWIASSVITCPVGYKYDLVYLEVEQPGSSYVEVSILNASKEASEIGFANETIPPHARVRSTDHSVDDISPALYPRIRIQVNLVASGEDRPRLTGWSLYFIGLDEWRDDFLFPGKMESSKNINMTEGNVEINLTRKTGGQTPPSYLAYPTIAIAGGATSVEIFYPKSDHTGYQDIETKEVGGQSNSCDFFKFWGRDKMDLIVGKETGVSILSHGPSGLYSGPGSSGFSGGPGSVKDVGFGDLNGDGRRDMAIACSVNSVFMLSKGGGEWTTITLTGQGYLGAQVGDINRDGYNDTLFMNANEAKVFFGGPDGPDTVADITLSVSGGSECLLEDLNDDGYLDIVPGGSYQGKLPIFMGDWQGLDTSPDYLLATPGTTIQAVASGDINGDEYRDIVVLFAGSSNNVWIYEGTAAGWSDSRVHTSISVETPTHAMDVGDLDLDGYCDLVISFGDPTSTRIYSGGIVWPQTASMTMAGGQLADLAIAIPNATMGSQVYQGTIITEPISIGIDQKWDMLLLEGLLPPNTTMRLSVLDDAHKVIPGFGDLTDWNVDLSSIISTRTIHVIITLKTEFNWTTPVLDRLTIKWMGNGCWRDQFYGTLRTEHLLNVGIIDGQLQRGSLGGEGPQILFPSLRGDAGYDKSTPVFLDAGGGDYLSWAPKAFNTLGVAAADAADINGDGILDVAFAVLRTADDVYTGYSPIFLGSPVGWSDVPAALISTMGASDVLLRDLNADGHVDLLFAQEQDGTSYAVNSTLFWGDGKGWNATPDLQFQTTGASGVEALDLDGDDKLDLVFSCYRDASSSTATDSLVFLQGATGFCGTNPSYRLPTKGARAVAAGDLDGDGLQDLAFANSLSGGVSEINSFIYWGKTGGGFESTPAALRTVGAEDVKLADLDGDSDLDVVFANCKDNGGSYAVESYVYLNDGSRAFPSTPSAKMSTEGAVAVAVADLDGTGYGDLVFACQYDGTSYNASSIIYLGGTSGWSSTPDISLQTAGASDVLVAHLIKAGQGGYMSKAITPEDLADTGAFHTFRYTSDLGTEQSGKVQLMDATTWEVLAETPLQSGAHEWLVRDEFKFKEHQSVRVAVTVEGLDKPGDFSLDDLWMNWTPRVKRSPQVLDLTVSSPSVYRLQSATVWLNATDEYDPAKDLFVTLEHRPSGTMVPWATSLLAPYTLVDGTWMWVLTPKVDASVGPYEIRVNVTDRDGMASGYIVFPGLVEVLNNRPTAPVVRMEPASPVTTSTLQVLIVTPATDIESGALTYRYEWYRDGVLQENLTSDTVLSIYTTRGENWSVEVRAFDGLDESPPGMAWTAIGNAAPFVKKALPNPELEEDATDDQWLNLTGAFEDPDGDPLTWTVSPIPRQIQVTIDHATGRITLRPEANWNGQEILTFIASDGQSTISQTVLVIVTAVDDMPVFTTVNGESFTTDPVTFTIDQGELLVIQLGTSDVEGDELSFSVNSTMVQIDETTGEIRFQTDNDIVGTLRFSVTMTEVQFPSVRVKLNLAVTVVNVNDPPAEPQITSPRAGVNFTAEQNFTLVGFCTDPDSIFGQMLNYTWWWNGTNLIGHGSSLTWSVKDAGTYVITLSVTDGEFTKTSSVEILIEAKETVTPPPVIPSEEEERETPYGLIVGAVVAVCIILLVTFLLVSRRRATELEAKDEAQEKREAFKHMAAEVGATAAQMEREVAEAKATKPAEAAKEPEPVKMVMETVGPDGKVTVPAESVPTPALAVQPKETEAASKETERLFTAIESAGPTVSAEEQERLRVENLKRKYQTAISRLPYGIPAAELKDKEWTWIAGALAMGERKTLPDGREVTLIEGRWYFSDVKDASTFLTEHGAKPRVEPARAPPKSAVSMTDKATLLKKLDERYILGEISEEKYEELKRKLTG